jgi:hypothetical protein
MKLLHFIEADGTGEYVVIVNIGETVSDYAKPGFTLSGIYNIAATQRGDLHKLPLDSTLVRED